MPRKGYGASKGLGRRAERWGWPAGRRRVEEVRKAPDPRQPAEEIEAFGWWKVLLIGEKVDAHHDVMERLAASVQTRNRYGPPAHASFHCRSHAERLMDADRARCLSTAPCVTGMGPTDGATAPPEGGNVAAAHGPSTLGDTRAVMIEGPSRDALEVVEVAPARQ